MAVAATIRAFGLLVRAGAPRRSHANSLRARLRRTCSWPAARASRSARCLEEAGIAALVDVAATSIELEESGRDPVEDVTIVRHQNESTPMHGEALLEPRDGVDVKMVGGFVKNQQDVFIGFTRQADLDERAGERDALGLTARQRDRHVVEPATEVEAVEDRRRIPRPPDDIADRGPGQRGILIEHDDACAAPATHDTGLRFDVAGELAQQRRLAAAVQPDDGEPVAGLDGDRHVREQRPPGPAGGQADGVNEDHERSPATAAGYGPTARRRAHGVDAPRSQRRVTRFSPVVAGTDVLSHRDLRGGAQRLVHHTVTLG